MNELDKCVHADDNTIESKEGEQRRLSSNNVSTCSPSLDLTTTENTKAEEDQNFILTPRAIKAFTEFAVILKRIHVRLAMEGYVIKDGEIYAPDEIENNETSNTDNNTNP